MAKVLRPPARVEVATVVILKPELVMNEELSPTCRVPLTKRLDSNVLVALAPVPSTSMNPAKVEVAVVEVAMIEANDGVVVPTRLPAESKAITRSVTSVPRLRVPPETVRSPAMVVLPAEDTEKIDAVVESRRDRIVVVSVDVAVTVRVVSPSGAVVVPITTVSNSSPVCK